jgi:hypothetical protein
MLQILEETMQQFTINKCLFYLFWNKNDNNFFLSRPKITDIDFLTKNRKDKQLENKYD